MMEDKYDIDQLISNLESVDFDDLDVDIILGDQNEEENESEES